MIKISSNFVFNFIKFCAIVSFFYYTSNIRYFIFNSGKCSSSSSSSGSGSGSGRSSSSSSSTSTTSSTSSTSTSTSSTSTSYISNIRYFVFNLIYFSIRSSSSYLVIYFVFNLIYFRVYYFIVISAILLSIILILAQYLQYFFKSGFVR